MSKLDSNTVVWLIGGSSGIGEALTYQINKTGAKIIISARRESELERVKSNCQYPENISILTVDLAQADELPGKGQQALSIHGRVDILINGGGISQRSAIIDTDISVDRRLMEIDYFGAIALTKSVLPKMVEQQAGHQVVLSSATGIISTPWRSAYCAAKHALHGYYDALRAEHVNDNIKVSIICPGFIKTNISINALVADGTPQNKMDNAQGKGMSAEVCARHIVKAIQNDKQEVYIGGLKEKAGIYVKRFFPGLFARIVAKSKVT
ncbi:MAG: SDR family oxidoreductase [Cyclobacteriaceae bacterium]